MPLDRDFWGKLATKHGLTAEQAALINDGLLDELNEMALRRDDAKTLIATTQAEKQAAEQAKNEAMAKYRENLEWFGKKEADLRLVDQYRARYGELTADGETNRNPTTVTSPATFTRDQAQEMVSAAQRQVYTLNKEILKADREYQKHFGKPLPIEELEQLALKPENAGRNFKDVFSDWVQPQLVEKNNLDVEARIKTAREEGEKAGIAKGRMREPSQSSPDEFSPIYSTRVKPEEKLDDATLQRHFIETHDKVMEADRSSGAAN